MIDSAFARHFAADWIEAWNRHDLGAILAHYADDFEMRSPYMRRSSASRPACCAARRRRCSSWAQTALSSSPPRTTRTDPKEQQ